MSTNTNSQIQILRERSRRQAQENINRWLGRSDSESAKPNITVDEIITRIAKTSEQQQATQTASLIPSPQQPQVLKRILSTSPARLGVWRAGSRYLTQVLLKLRGDHAVAKDAVYAELKPGFAENFGWIPLKTLAKDKEDFLLRPDHGRKLSPESQKVVLEKGIKNPHIQITVADGLSAWATERYAKPMVDELMMLFKKENMTVGTVFCVNHSRIAIQDEIGEAVGAKLSLILLGERPGLGTGDSLSNYMIYGPKIGAVNAKKSMISNIHNGGIMPVEAAQLTVSMIKKMFEQGCSGIELKL